MNPRQLSQICVSRNYVADAAYKAPEILGPMLAGIGQQKGHDSEEYKTWGLFANYKSFKDRFEEKIKDDWLQHKDRLASVAGFWVQILRDLADRTRYQSTFDYDDAKLEPWQENKLLPYLKSCAGITE